MLPRALRTAGQGRDASAEPTRYAEDPGILGPGAMNRGWFLRKGQTSVEAMLAAVIGTWSFGRSLWAPAFDTGA